MGKAPSICKEVRTALAKTRFAAWIQQIVGWHAAIFCSELHGRALFLKMFPSFLVRYRRKMQAETTHDLPMSSRHFLMRLPTWCEDCLASGDCGYAYTILLSSLYGWANDSDYLIICNRQLTKKINVICHNNYDYVTAIVCRSLSIDLSESQWGRSIFSSGRLLTDMMMMAIEVWL